MLSSKTIKFILISGGLASISIVPQTVRATSPKENVYAIVIKVSGDVKVLEPNKKVITKITEKTKLKEGSKITIGKHSSMHWVRREYDQTKIENIIGPAEFDFPSKISGRLYQLNGQRSLGGVYRGDSDSTDIECTYPETIKIPKTKTVLPFLQLTCNRSLRYQDIRYEVTQNGNAVKSGMFFDGFKNTTLTQGSYRITFYNKASKLIESKLEIDSFDLDSRLSEIINDKQKLNIPTDLMASLELCQIGYRYICQMNLDYQVILKDKTIKSTKNLELTRELKKMLDDSLNYQPEKGE
ncbi:hypothetical protein LZP73_19015 [Shewanella sp. AS16]|uniref:hypothetical protein n=1 Tax=Shewanella sp. AS16 TaxID=2907625 RepID=UPI001F2CFA7C|nr:hypothetical protein [Shewanella sp. AS16]MCE9688264.1 hypothetical protein [Shewanella sp. AS16]